MTLDEALAQCQARKLGTSACLDLIDGSNACLGRLPTATAGPGGVVFSCSSVPSAKKAAVLLAEAEAQQPKAGLPGWLVVGGIGALLAGVVYLATR